MSIGIAVTKDQIDALTGGVAREIHRQINRGLDMFQAMQDVTDQQLTALGYTAQELADLRQAVSDMQDLSKVYRGAMALAAAKDFRVSFKKIYGLPVG